MTEDEPDWKTRAKHLSNTAWEAVKEINQGAFVDTGTPTGKLSQLVLELAKHLGKAGQEIDSLRASVANAEARYDASEARNEFLTGVIEAIEQAAKEAKELPK
jgi:hypothetical protein